MSARAFTMPKWGIEMREGTLAEWLVAEGASFNKGDVLALVETDKITNEIEAEFAGRLARVVVPAGETVPVGALLGVFADAGAEADVDAVLARFGNAAPAAAAPVPAASALAPAPFDGAISPAARELAAKLGVDPATVAGSGRGGRVTHQDVAQTARPPAPAPGGPPVSVAPPPETGAFASPSARRAALQHGVDLARATPTGPRGRICKADVLALVAPVPAEGAPEIVPMTALQRTAARRLTEAKAAIPHFYLRADVAVDALLALRRAAHAVTGAKASVNDHLVRAAALALLEVPAVNIQVHGEAIHRFRAADVAVAVDTPKGLMTPVVRAAETLLPHDIGAAVRALAERARAGRLTAADIAGGSFTVSNLGMFGVESFDAIINPPHGAILAVGAARRVWAERDGGGAFETRIALTLSCDHRAVDGATGARFLAALKALIETPERLYAR